MSFLIYRQSKYIFMKINCRSLSRNVKYNQKVLPLNNQIEQQQQPKNSIPFLRRKVNAVFSFYEEISGMDEVRIAQDKVILVQEQLKEAQDKRRDLIFKLSGIRKQLQVLHSEILNCGRGESRYLDLVKKEIELIQSEKETHEIFTIADTQERELFSHLTSAVKMSHEKERSQANTVKYWSIIGSILGALLGIIASGLSYRYRNTQILELKQQSNDAIREIILLGTKIDGLQSVVNEFSSNRNVIEQPDKNVAAIESWGSYLKRISYGSYRYLIGKRFG